MYCANSLSCLRLRVARLYLICIAEYRIDRIFRYTYIETLILEHLRHDVWHETYMYIYNYI